MAKGKKKGRFAAKAGNRTPANVSLAYTPDVSYKILEYGKGNSLPHDIIRTFSGSPTAVKCWNKLSKFIKADGFASGATGKLRVNPLQTLDDLLPEIAFDATVFGFALRVKYNTALKVGEVYHVPFHHVLKLTNGQFLVNPTLGTKDYNKLHDEILDGFDDSPEAVQSILAKAQELDRVKADPKNQPGQLLYVYLKNSLTPHYPVPEAWAGRLDMETEPYILKADHKSIKRRVQVGTHVYIPGSLDDTTEDDKGKTELQYANEAIADLYDEERDFVITTGATKEDAPQINMLDTFATLGSSTEKRETIGRAICRWWGLAPELLGWSTPGQLGNKEQLETIIGMLQQDVLDIQGLIQRTVERLFPAFDGTLTNYNILGDIPQRQWELMTEDEKRNVAGLPELQPTEATTNGTNASGFSRLRALFAKRQ
jgi:hypothetical protein